MSWKEAVRGVSAWRPAQPHPVILGHSADGCAGAARTVHGAGGCGRAAWGLLMPVGCAVPPVRTCLGHPGWTRTRPSGTHGLTACSGSTISLEHLIHTLLSASPFPWWPGWGTCLDGAAEYQKENRLIAAVDESHGVFVLRKASMASAPLGRLGQRPGQGKSSHTRPPHIHTARTSCPSPHGRGKAACLEAAAPEKVPPFGVSWRLQCPHCEVALPPSRPEVTRLPGPGLLLLPLGEQKCGSAKTKRTHHQTVLNS